MGEATCRLCFITKTPPQHYHFLMIIPERLAYSPPVMSGWQHTGAFVVQFRADIDSRGASSTWHQAIRRILARWINSWNF